MFNWLHIYVLKFKDKLPEEFGLLVVHIIARNKKNAEMELVKRVDLNKFERFTYGTNNYFKALFGMLPFTWFYDNQEKGKTTEMAEDKVLIASQLRAYYGFVKPIVVDNIFDSLCKRDKKLADEVERLKKVIDSVDNILTSDSKYAKKPWVLIDEVLLAIGKRISDLEETPNGGKK